MSKPVTAAFRVAFSAAAVDRINDAEVKALATQLRKAKAIDANDAFNDVYGSVEADRSAALTLADLPIPFAQGLARAYADKLEAQSEALDKIAHRLGFDRDDFNPTLGWKHGR